MTELRLIAGAALADPPTGGTVTAVRLPPGRHGLPADLVRAHQRHRLLEAAAKALADEGYGRITAARVTELAGVSSRTFYQHFEDLWACLLAAYETEGDISARRSRTPAWGWTSRIAADGRGPASVPALPSSPMSPPSPGCSVPSRRRRSRR
jgi:Bacterial regulatory proteins, tetR family